MNYDEEDAHAEWQHIAEVQQWESRTTRDIVIERCVKYIKLLKLKKELRNARKNSWQELSDRR